MGAVFLRKNCVVNVKILHELFAVCGYDTLSHAPFLKVIWKLNFIVQNFGLSHHLGLDQFLVEQS